MISIWATGQSVDDIDIFDALEIKAKTITIGINFFDKFEPDYRIWLDEAVAKWLVDRIKRGDTIAPKLVTSRHGMYNNPELEHSFIVPCNGEVGGFITTFPTACRFVRDNFHGHDVYVFGADFAEPDHRVLVDGVIKRIEPLVDFITGYPLQKHSFNQSKLGVEELHKERKFERWYNCSPISTLSVWPKANYKEVIL